jgi:hypothetical protein
MKRGMKYVLATLSTVICLGAPTSEAARADSFARVGRIGVGVGGGTLANGLSAKFYVAPRTALQAVLGLSHWGLSFSGDFIKEFRPFVRTPVGDMFAGVGVGAGLVRYRDFNDEADVVGISGILELGWHFNEVPLELILDWRPTYYFGDFIGGFFFGGGGGAIRWFL